MGKVSKLQPCIEIFGTVNEGINFLRSLKEKFTLDYRFCKYAVESHSEGIAAVKDLSALPLLDFHNKLIQQAVDFVTEIKPSCYVLDKGRTKDERSCIWIQDGHYYGMGYISNEISVTNPEQLKDFVTRYKSSSYIMQLISVYAGKYPDKVYDISS